MHKSETTLLDDALLDLLQDKAMTPTDEVVVPSDSFDYTLHQAAPVEHPILPDLITFLRFRSLLVMMIMLY